MSFNNKLRRDSMRRNQSSTFNSSSDHPHPLGMTLSNIFKPSNNHTNQETPLSARYYVPPQSVAKPDETFVPFVRERDHMNRLLCITNRSVVKKSASSKDILSSTVLGKTKDLTASTLVTPRDKRGDLPRLLSLDPNAATALHDSTSRVVASDISACLQEGEAQPDQCPMLRFKLNIPKIQKVIISHKPSLSGHSSAREKKHSVAFLKNRRNEQLHLRTQSSIEYPSVGHYDMQNADMLKPRLQNVVFSKLELQRNKATPPARETIYSRESSSVERKQPGYDWTKQTNRANKCVETERKETAKAKEARMEAGSALTNNKSLFAKTKLPKGVIVNKMMPYDMKLMKEISAHMMKRYNISNAHVEDARSNRASKIKNIDPRTIEEAWVQHFA